MTQKLFAFIFFATLSLPALSLANDVIEFQGRKMVLLNETSITEIETILATNSAELTDDQKMDKIQTVLKADAEAVGGFCETAAATYGIAGGKPTPDRVTDACNETFSDSALGEGIVNGELMAQFPAGKSLREGLSQIISAFTLMLSTGVF